MTVVCMGIRILVIEDEKPIADFIVRGLREEGFSVIGVKNACMPK